MLTYSVNMEHMKNAIINSFSQWNSENSQKLKNCPNFSGLLPVSLWIRPKSEYGKMLSSLYRSISHTQICDVSTRKKVSRYNTECTYLLCYLAKNWLQNFWEKFAKKEVLHNDWTLGGIRENGTLTKYTSLQN